MSFELGFIETIGHSVTCLSKKALMREGFILLSSSVAAKRFPQAAIFILSFENSVFSENL